MQGLRAGRIVDVVAKDGTTHEAAFVVKVYEASETIPEGTIDCDVHGLFGMRRARVVKHDPEMSAGTWHWLEQA